MQSPEEFMRQYFEARIAQERREAADRVPFRRKYFAECFQYSRAGRLQMFLSEKVISISSSETQAEVITTRANLGMSDQIYYSRYRLEGRHDRWQILDFELQCCACNGEPGNAKCPACHGTGWKSTNMSRQATAAACGTDGSRTRNNLIAIACAPAAAARRLWLHLHR